MYCIYHKKYNITINMGDVSWSFSLVTMIYIIKLGHTFIYLKMKGSPYFLFGH